MNKKNSKEIDSLSFCGRFRESVTLVNSFPKIIFLSEHLNAMKSNMFNVLMIKTRCILVIKKYQKGLKLHPFSILLQ